MLQLVAAALLSVAPVVTVVDRSLDRAPDAAPGTTAASTSTCDDGSFGGTLVQRGDMWYGNELQPGCAAARIERVRFAHFGYGLEGPYAFRLHLLDAECRPLGVSPELAVAGAPQAPAWADVDVTALGWCVTGPFLLALEPRTCADGAAGRDCFPALVVDATSGGDGGAHCARVVVDPGSDPGCYAAQSADGRHFDFLLRVDLSCGAAECALAVAPGTWSLVKRLYASPR
jgi:hypothetical protein